MTQYGRFAEVYDQMGADEFSTEMVAYTLRIMKRLQIKPENMLDLCCGTGTALELFHNNGLKVSGLDGSSKMIKQARKKLTGKSIPLYCQMMPRFEILERGKIRRRKKFDLVTCYYDALNYMLSKTDLETAFRSVYRHLGSGGVFVFDMNTPEALKTIWGSNVWGGVRDELCWVWRNKYDSKKVMAECRTTFFIKSGRTWKRFDELHVEKGYSNSEIKRSLRQAGFVIRGYYRCMTYSKPTAGTMRICVVAQRKD